MRLCSTDFPSTDGCKANGGGVSYYVFTHTETIPHIVFTVNENIIELGVMLVAFTAKNQLNLVLYLPNVPVCQVNPDRGGLLRLGEAARVRTSDHHCQAIRPLP
jgi:hypothetical protein